MNEANMSELHVAIDSLLEGGYKDDTTEVEIIVPEPPVETVTERPEDIIRAKIIATLNVYPVLSPSMLQAALGASLSPQIWKPTLNAMIQEGVVSQWDEAPKADEEGGISVRQRPYPCLALAAAAADQVFPA